MKTLQDAVIRLDIARCMQRHTDRIHEEVQEIVNTLSPSDKAKWQERLAYLEGSRPRTPMGFDLLPLIDRVLEANKESEED